jgi:Tetracyclin repressor-like, C-terminal domain
VTAPPRSIRPIALAWFRVNHNAVSEVVAGDASEGVRGRSFARFWEDRHDRGAAVTTRAVDRGELPAGTDARRVLIAATAPVYYQLVLLRQPMTRAQADQFARDAAAGQSTRGG